MRVATVVPDMVEVRPSNLILLWPTPVTTNHRNFSLVAPLRSVPRNATLVFLRRDLRQGRLLRSLRAGKRSAAVMSLVHSARLNGHEPYAYLREVLERLPTQPASRVADLLPHRWQLQTDLTT